MQTIFYILSIFIVLDAGATPLLLKWWRHKGYRPIFLLLPYALLVPVISSLVTLLMISLPLFYPFYQLAVIIVTIFLLYKLRGLFKDGLQEQSDGRYFFNIWSIRRLYTYLSDWNNNGCPEFNGDEVVHSRLSKSIKYRESLSLMGS